MNERGTLVRKLIYVALIVALLIPLSRLSEPATRQSAGGTLASLRQKYNLSQAELGDIDPSSVTMRLATMGLGTIAVNILWTQSNEYKKKEDWISFGAALEQIVKLQPNFFKVWDFQAHNLSYNISAEFDDYKDKYTYVIKGIHFLRQGAEKNENEPRLLHRLGWYIGQKVGRADEHKLYRELFKADWNALFHAVENPDRPLNQRDNWLVSKEYFRAAENLADTLEGRGIPLRTSPIIFFSEAPKSQINYSEMRQLEGNFIEQKALEETKRSWEQARADWIDYGLRPLPTSFGGRIRLEDYENLKALAAELKEKLEALAPGVRERLRDERIARLDSPEKQQAARLKQEDRSPQQQVLYDQIEGEVEVPWDDVADEVLSDKRAEAKELANQLVRTEDRVHAISIERTKVNYDYWRIRGIAESDDNTLVARRLTYQAGRLLDEANPFDAIPLYEQAWQKWREVIDRYPRMAGDSVSADELVEDINRYKRAIAQTVSDKAERDKKIGPNFILQDVIDIAEGKVSFSPDELEAKEVEANLKAREKPAADNDKPAPDETSPDAAPGSAGG